jgi:hypothetical protein
MKLINLLKIDLKRALLSWRFLLSTCGVCLIMLATVSGMLKNSHSVLYLTNISLQGSGTASLILCVLPVFAFSISFASQWEERSVSFWIVRSGAVRYTISKIIISAISGFLIIAVGVVLFTIILLPWNILYFSGESIGNSYETIMQQRYILGGYVLYISHFALSGALAAVCAMCVSIFFPNRFVAAASPVVLYYTLGRITANMNLKSFLSPTYWIESIYNTVSPITTLSIKFATVFILCLIMCILAVLKMKERISYV